MRSIEQAILERRARSVSVGARASTSVGGATQVAYAKQIDAAVDQHDRQIKVDLCNGEPFCGGKVGPHKSTLAYLNAWNDWLQDWRRYYNENVNITFPDPEQTTLDSWRAQLDDFTRRFKATGAVVTAPPLPNPPVESGGGIPWRGLLIVGGVIAAAMLLREIRPEREAITSRLAAA